MCDYSLMAVPNRLAREGEELVTHRFPTGSLGLASPADVARASAQLDRPSRTLWQKLREFFDPPSTIPVCAVCIPPGARLRVEDIPARMQQDHHLGPVEVATFTQLTNAVNTYRDALCFANGCQVRLQELRQGQRVRVLDLSAADELDLDNLRFERLELAYRR